jgi:hypothetical protein
LLKREEAKSNAYYSAAAAVRLPSSDTDDKRETVRLYYLDGKGNTWPE